jgi:hypothetical protein
VSASDLPASPIVDIGDRRLRDAWRELSSSKGDTAVLEAVRRPRPGATRARAVVAWGRSDLDDLRNAMSYMTCPRCGLSVRLRASFLVLERCPRCVARARMLVPMRLSEEKPPPSRTGREEQGSDREAARPADRAPCPGTADA